MLAMTNPKVTAPTPQRRLSRPQPTSVEGRDILLWQEQSQVKAKHSYTVLQPAHNGLKKNAV